VDKETERVYKQKFSKRLPNIIHKVASRELERLQTTTRSMVDYIDTPTMGDILSEGLFSAAKIARLKNTSSLLIANITHYMCAFRARIEQLPKLTLCSVVQF